MWGGDRTCYGGMDTSVCRRVLGLVGKQLGSVDRRDEGYWMSEARKGRLLVLDGVSLEAFLVGMVCRYYLEEGGNDG